jgi:hypothetical protein
MDGENACQDPDDISVQNGGWLVAGDAADGAGRIATDPGELQPGIEVIRRYSSVVVEDVLGGEVKIACA